LLAQRSEFGYVDRLDRAMHDEPEAISEHEQRDMSQRARLDWVERRRRAWSDATAVIFPALDTFTATLNGDRPLQHAVRGVRRAADAVGRRL
jgi:hypothetical protein